MPGRLGSVCQGVSAQGMSAQDGVSEGGDVSPGGVLPRGVSAQEGCLPKRGVCPGCLADTSVNRMTDSCNTLPCHNYVADGKYEVYTPEGLRTQHHSETYAVWGGILHISKYNMNINTMSSNKLVILCHSGRIELYSV